MFNRIWIHLDRKSEELRSHLEKVLKALSVSCWSPHQKLMENHTMSSDENDLVEEKPQFYTKRKPVFNPNSRLLVTSKQGRSTTAPRWRSPGCRTWTTRPGRRSANTCRATRRPWLGGQLPLNPLELELVVWSVE